MKAILDLLKVAATTAPKTKGLETILIKIIAEKGEIEKICKKMEEIGKRKYKFFLRDAKCLERADAIILLGINNNIDLKLNCGYVFDKCEECKAKNFPCIFKIIDLGIAIGSVVKMASLLNLDNRVMYSVGEAARELKLIDSNIVIGIAIAWSSIKNPFFDRK